MSRRSFLRLGAAAGTGVYASVATGRLGASGAWAASPSQTAATPPPSTGLRHPGSRPRPDLAAGTDTLPGIEHIVVLMMENHSYDNYFGLLGRGDGLTVGSDGAPVNESPDGAGRAVRSFHMPTTCQSLHLSLQSWNASHIEFNGGRNDGFVRSGGGTAAMGYLTPNDLPFYAGLARTFPLADRWFASCLGPTHPNRRFLIAGTAAGLVHNRGAISVETPPAGGTVFNLLDRYGLTWRDYHVTDSTAGLYMSAVAGHRANLVPVEQFFSDAEHGTLPNFCIVDPDFQHSSEESPMDVTVGEAFAASVINAVLKSPAWAKTVLIWCYDEHGGYYDHVPPPPSIPPDSIPAQLVPGDAPGGFDRYGFRVPAVVVSPFARPNYVSHAVHDHTSILKLVETKWNLPALTYRDANASNLLDCLDLRTAAFLEPPRLPAPANPQGVSRCLPPVGRIAAGNNPVLSATTVAAPTRPVDHVHTGVMDSNGIELVTAAAVLGATAATAVVGRTRLLRVATGIHGGRAGRRAADARAAEPEEDGVAPDATAGQPD
jgi:phospholipase C